MIGYDNYVKIDKREDVSHLSEPTSKLSLRSQEWIQTALFQLMEKKEYSRISITEIADTAGLARQTFYRNFQDKDEILLKYLAGLMREMWKDFHEKSILDEEMFITLFRNWKQNVPLSLINNIFNRDRKIRQIIFRSVSDYVDELFMREPSEKKGSKPDKYRLYAQKSFASIIHMMLIEWTLQEFNLSSEEMGALVNDLTASMREFLQSPPLM